VAAQWANNTNQDRYNRVRSSGNVVLRDAMTKRVKEARHVSVAACIDMSGGTSCGARARQVIHRFRATRCCELRPLPHSVGVIERNDDVPNEYQLTSDELVQLQRIIEAGLLARDARLSGAGFADATEQELRLLEDQGALARQRFIQANLGLVGMVSRQFAARCQLPDAELFQEGCLGLITAVERFDYARGNRFSTYALFWIRAVIGAATAKHLGAMNLPTSRAEQLRAAHGLEAELGQTLGRAPTLREMADALGRTEDWTAGLLAHQRPRSLELVDGTTLEGLHARDELDAVLTQPLPVRDLLSRLDDLERRVLELRLGFADGEPRSFAHTARVLHISITRVRRIEARALETLRGFCPQQASAQL
jgi:RNA polymerase primary sigma factor